MSDPTVEEVRAALEAAPVFSKELWDTGRPSHSPAVAEVFDRLWAAARLWVDATSELQAAIDMLTASTTLTFTTRHNAADFANATAVVVEAARKYQQILNTDVDPDAATERILDRMGMHEHTQRDWDRDWDRAYQFALAALDITEAPDGQ